LIIPNEWYKKMLASKLRLDQIVPKLRANRVLMRVDFNVPIKNGKINDLTRITSTLESINFIRQAGAKSVVLMSHLGRPDGEVNPKYSLRPLIPELNRLLGTEVQFLPDCVGPEVEEACRLPKPGSIILLENLRYHLEEEGSVKQPDGTKKKASPENISAFRKSLTELGDIYVNDAFGTAHRAHSSVVGIDLKVRAAGFLMSKELSYFSQAIENPKRPLLVILGGAKVKDKIPLIMNLIKLSDEMIIAGGMCFTFKQVLQKYSISQSLFDKDSAGTIENIMLTAKNSGKNIHLPVDFWCGKSGDSNDQPVLGTTEIPPGLMGLDIGPASVKLFTEVVNRAGTVIWNGPPGFFENPLYKSGSQGLFEAIVKHPNLVSIVGGGDTASFVQGQGELARKISHISTGGGASLELLEGKVLPGISALSTS
jgi:phosphoglycerate kinase